MIQTRDMTNFKKYRTQYGHDQGTIYKIRMKFSEGNSLTIFIACVYFILMCDDYNGWGNHKSLNYFIIKHVGISYKL